MTPKIGISLGHQDTWVNENVVTRVVLQGQHAVVETKYNDKIHGHRDSVEKSYPVKHRHVLVVIGDKKGGK